MKITNCSGIGLSICVLLGLSVMAQADPQARVDTSFDRIETAVDAAGMLSIVQIDHARLAAKEGIEMPPARVQLFSDITINSALLQENIRVGLDLPFRVLSYDDQGKPAVLYTASEFIKIRHQLNDTDALRAFDRGLDTVFDLLGDIGEKPVTTAGVTKDFAIIQLQSQYGVAETVARLKKTISAQDDTIWFGSIDFQKDAASVAVALPPAQLLLFGGPAPGGVAMAEYPAIGLDAFCQKLLVYEGADGKAVVLFNDIKALAQLHYASSIAPHTQLNKRLTATFTKAIN